MKHNNQNLLRHYFTEPTSHLSADYNAFDIHTKDMCNIDPEIEKMINDLNKFKYSLKMFSLKLLQQSSKAKYQLETIRGLNTKALIIEKQINQKSYLSQKSILEIKNRLKNYIFTFNIIRGEYLKPL